MFGLIYTTNNQQQYHDDILIISGGPETPYYDALINGRYTKTQNSEGSEYSEFIHNDPSYDYDNMSYWNAYFYHDEGEPAPQAGLTNIIKSTFGNLFEYDDEDENTIYINGQLSNLNKDSLVWFISCNFNIEWSEWTLGYLYYNLNENPWEGTWTKFNFTKIFGSSKCIDDIQEYNELYSDLYGKTFEQLPNSITVQRQII